MNRDVALVTLSGTCRVPSGLVESSGLSFKVVSTSVITYSSLWHLSFHFHFTFIGFALQHQLTSQTGLPTGQGARLRLNCHVWQPVVQLHNLLHVSPLLQFPAATKVFPLSTTIIFFSGRSLLAPELHRNSLAL